MDYILLLLFAICSAVASGHPSLEAGQKLLGRAAWQFDVATDVSTISCVHGHYPPPFCTSTNIALNHATKTFTVYSEDADVTFANKFLFRVAAEPKDNFPKCDQTIDEAYLFTFYFYHGQSNYFHLHEDTLFPIFSLLQAKMTAPDATDRPVALMPVVELERMAKINWDSGAFGDRYLDKYFLQVLMALAGTEHALLPLDSNLVKKSPHGFTCFRKAYIGAPSLRTVEKSPTFMDSFVKFMMDRLDVEPGRPARARVGLIKRGGRRKILNEGELVAAASKLVDTDLVEFNGMSVREQVQTVQKYTVLIGMNGAGFMNAIYLPAGAVAVQLAPFNATMLNVQEFGEIVASRQGSAYLFWRNTHSDLHHPVPHDSYDSQANTVVNVEEFIDLIEQALHLGINKDLRKSSASGSAKVDSGSAKVEL